ncbi:MAG: leucine-rich repeat domain-containing protein [Candidatus Poribacteria bacterium]|nr:leucine-rich repeat domain-containing protein [Candidatus Poribacteria bacterium]
MKTLFVNRNVIVSIFAVLMLTYGIQGISYGQDAPDTIVEFADANLARVVRKALGLPTGDGVDLLKIPKAELEKLTELRASGKKITDLTGLENATQLMELHIRVNNISDITPLAQLTQLKRLDLSYNQIGDITPLVRLAQLKTLNLNRNHIRDITPLAQLTQLTGLELDSTQISDITPLTQLTQLRGLYLLYNQISDITPLAQLTQLETLFFIRNQVSDITPLTQLTQLRGLYLSYNQISDVTPLAQLTKLTELNLRDNLITDVTPLTGLIFLERLELRRNPIWSTYPLNALLDANPNVDLDIEVTDAVPFPMTEATSKGGKELRVLIPELQQQPMFWVNTDTGKIESSGHFDVVTQGVTVLTVDRAGSKLYWGERSQSGGVIKRANFDGTNVEALVTLSNVPRGIAIDAIGNKLYWTNSDLQIQTATLNGENISTIIQLEEDILEETKKSCSSGFTFFLFFIPIGQTTGECSTETVRLNLTSPTDIAVNTVDGRLYWTEFSGRIRRVNLDGTGLGTLLPEIGSPYGIVVVDDKIYWAEEIGEHSGKVQRANLNGTNIETLATVQGLPTGISVDTAAGKVYWANSLGGIQRTDINGGEVEVVVSGIAAPGDFVLVPSVRPTTPTTATTDATVNISPASVASPAVGEQITFNLNIAGGEAVAGYQATVQFDTTALRYVSSANGDYLPAGAFFVEPKVEGNLIKLNAASLAGESSGDGTLTTLTFEVIAVKGSTLTLSDVLLTNSAGEGFVPTVENAEITEAIQLTGDINGDGIINIQDLVLTASNLGKTGQNPADVNGDGSVNIQDLVLVAGALGTSAAAPSLHPQSLETLTATEVKQWLSAAQHLDLTDTTSRRGILFLQQLLITLTPKETALLANYPNPFNPETWIPYHLAKDADVTLHIYAVNGTLVRTLILGYQAAGMYQSRSRAAYWDGRNAFGEPVASGVYFYTLTAGDFTATRKMLIMK